MGAFMPGPFTSPKKGGSRSLSRSSSRSSLTGWSSESEEEEGQVEKRCARAFESCDERAMLTHTNDAQTRVCSSSVRRPGLPSRSSIGA